MMAKNTLPSYHPAFTAPRSAVGRVAIDGCLNWSRPFVYTNNQVLLRVVIKGWSIQCGPEQARHEQRPRREEGGVCSWWWLKPLLLTALPIGLLDNDRGSER
jgi:hypothetical protein